VDTATETEIMKQNTLKELYLDELRDIYNAENQLVKALPWDGRVWISTGRTAPSNRGSRL
jgi:Domain of unknown function (DUF892)